jgi:NADPH:quinone reductase-like Zn-dependent oxidoreductase
VDLETNRLEDTGEADVVFDVIGGDILKRSTALVRAGGTLVTIAEPPAIQPENGRAIFFVVEADRSQLVELAQRLRDGRLTSNVGAVRPLAEAPAAFGPDAPRVSGKTVIQGTRSGGWRVNRLGYRRCQGPAASGEGAGWPACQAFAAWIR